MFDPPVAVASLSGRSDAAWAARAAPYVGAAFLGGIAIDAPTRRAAEAMIARDRTEFLPDDPHAFVDTQLAACDPLALQPAINVRTVSLEALEAMAEVCHRHDAILEINAHCRQEEMCQAGAGESLLTAPDRLTEQVHTVAETGATASVKLRTEVPDVDLPSLSEALDAAGADMLHVDAMDSEPVIADVVSRVTCPVIANNGVRDADTVAEYVEYGAAAVSVGRPSDDPTVLTRVTDAMTTLHPDPA